MLKYTMHISSARQVFPASLSQTKPWFLRQLLKVTSFPDFLPTVHSTPSCLCPSWPKVVTLAPDRLVQSHLCLLSWPHKHLCSFWAGTVFISSEVFTILCVALIFSKNSHFNMRAVISFLPSTSPLPHGYLSASQILLNPPGWVERSECSQFHCFSPLILLWL